MDYQEFYNEIVNWINQCNAHAVNLGMHSDEFWTWVMRSVGDISNRYGNSELVKRQMIMLVDWLQDMHNGVR